MEDPRIRPHAGPFSGLAARTTMIEGMCGAMGNLLRFGKSLPARGTLAGERASGQGRSSTTIQGVG
jgi:hypothetical protein